MSDSKRRWLHADGQNQFKCDHCGKCFSTKGNLLRHVQAVHIGGQVFPCPLCGKEFKRKEDMTTHTRIHTGEKPYKCKHLGCGKRFARNSDLRSHERTHDVNTRVFLCKYPGCGKTFTRPYDLKKHDLHQHQGHRARAANGDAAASTAPAAVAITPTSRVATIPTAAVATADASSACDRVKRGIGDMRPSLEFNVDTTSIAEKTMPFSNVFHGASPAGVCSHNAGPPPVMNCSRHHTTGRHESSGLSRTGIAIGSSRTTQYRKRVRCDAHKHHDISDSLEATRVGDQGMKTARSNVRDPIEGQHGYGVETAALRANDSKAHVHGANCGHVAVLHEGHVDFLMDGHLECFDGKEKTREGWVSFTNGGDETNCNCPAKPASKDDEEPNDNGDVHWDGGQRDEPRGTCMGDTHEPQCGHNLIVHHAGHVDYVVNGRLMHPVGDGTEHGLGDAFEDHGSIQAIGDDFLTFLETLDVLSENADKAVESYCDLCDRGEL